MVVRSVALLLAILWLGGGCTVLIYYIIQGRWKDLLYLVPAVLFALWYGLMWARVSYEGRQLKWPEAIFPWRHIH